MSEDMKPPVYIFFGMLALFCGLALCIHVYGSHWANPELQRAMMRDNYVEPKKTEME